LQRPRVVEAMPTDACKVFYGCKGCAMPKPIPYNYKCPNFECCAEYVAVERLDASLRKPKCIECATPFLAMQKGLHIHYEAAWPVTPALPDMA
jgi:hypothetical protein